MMKSSHAFWILCPLVFLLVVQAKAATDEQSATVASDATSHAVARVRDCIDAYYSGRMAEIQYRATNELAVLDAAEGLYLTEGTQTALVRRILVAHRLGGSGVEWLASGIAPAGCWTTRAVGGPAILAGMRERPTLLAAARIERAHARSSIVARAEYETTRLEGLWDYAISVQLAALESRIQGSAADKTVADVVGLVRGIIQSDEQSTALVGDAIVRQGDRIGTAEILVKTIHRNRIEFQKGTSVWEQRIGEVADERWRQTQ